MIDPQARSMVSALGRRIGRTERLAYGNGLERRTNVSGSTVSLAPGQLTSFVGRVVTQGPEILDPEADPGSPKVYAKDWTDERYWIRPVVAGNDSLVPTRVEPTEPGYEDYLDVLWEPLEIKTVESGGIPGLVTATNVAEITNTPRGGTHNVRPDTFVQVNAIYSRTTETSTARRYWWFYEPTGGFVWVRITGSAKLLGAQGEEQNRWTYTGVEQAFNPTGTKFSPRPRGRTITGILNSIESENNGMGVEGHGVDIGGSDYPTGFDVQPIRGNPVLRATPEHFDIEGNALDEPQWWVTYSNADDGTCNG